MAEHALRGGNTRSGNSRWNSVRRWLCALQDARTIRLEVLAQREDSDVLEPTQLGTWPATMIPGDLALQLCELLQDAANESGRNISGSAIALDAVQVVIARLPLKCRPDREVLDELSARDEMDGSSRGDRQQDQRHREAMARIWVSQVAELQAAHRDQFEVFRGMLEQSAKQLQQHMEYTTELQRIVSLEMAEAARAREERAQLESAIADAAVPSESDDQATQLLGKLAAPILMRLAQGSPSKSQQKDAPGLSDADDHESEPLSES